jgi:hypothetical protein
MIHHEPVNLHDVDLNSVLMVVMKVCLNQDEQGGQKNQLNQVVMILDAMKDDRLMDDQKMIHQKTNHQMMDDQKMDVRNYLDDLNFRDALPCAYSLISLKLIYFDHTKK